MGSVNSSAFSVTGRMAPDRFTLLGAGNVGVSLLEAPPPGGKSIAGGALALPGPAGRLVLSTVTGRPCVATKAAWFLMLSRPRTEGVCGRNLEAPDEAAPEVGATGPERRGPMSIPRNRSQRWNKCGGTKGNG
jgi:hypothetical protein